MSIVLDASVTLAWCFKDEATLATQSILKNLDTVPAYVPELWSLEIGNILLAAEKRNRIHYADIAQFISLLGKLNIYIDKGTHEKALHDILSLAYSEKLTTYDAAYLELAMRKGYPLASKNKAICAAANRIGVDVIL